jgi:hypothetical protein
MQLAIDLHPEPADTVKPLNPSLRHAVTLFYALCAGMLAYAGFAFYKRTGVERATQASAEQFQIATAESQRIQGEFNRIIGLRAKAGELAEWLAISPPTQALVLLITQEVEPNVAFSRLAIEMEQGQPSAKITIELNAPNPDSASRQVAKVQAALDRAGFRTATVDTDAPTPEGWRFSAIVALPRNGEFTQITAAPASR